MTPIPILVTKERGANVVILNDDTLVRMLVDQCCETTERAVIMFRMGYFCIFLLVRNISAGESNPGP